MVEPGKKGLMFVAREKLTFKQQLTVIREDRGALIIEIGLKFL
jgi:hypothetical protein